MGDLCRVLHLHRFNVDSRFDTTEEDGIVLKTATLVGSLATELSATDMNKLKQKNYSTRNQRNETVFCADCNKFTSKHNYRYNHLCQPLKEKKQQKAIVKTAIDPEQLKADIMKQLKEELQNEHKTAREKYATIKEEKNTQKKEKNRSLASKML